MLSSYECLKPESWSMNLVRRKASVQWTGGARGGKHVMTTESGVLKKARYSMCIPIKKDSATNPAELIAAAHAGSFSLALAAALGQAGTTSGAIATTATVTIERLAAGWTIVHLDLNVVARIPKMTHSEFIDATVAAKTTCLVSRLLRTNISMSAKLEK